jgi:hypothetical protein
MPPIKITSSDQINADLGDDAVIGGITLIPIYLYTEPTTEDDLNYSGCEYV